MNSTLKQFISFTIQTVVFFTLIPFVITLFLLIISFIKYGNILEFKQLLLLNDVGLSIVLFQSFLSPLFVFIFKRTRLIFLEFWSILYVTLPIHYLIYGRLLYEPGDSYIGFEPLIVVTILYYELFHDTYFLRKWMKLDSKYSIKSLLQKTKPNNA